MKVKITKCSGGEGYRECALEGCFSVKFNDGDQKEFFSSKEAKTFYDSLLQGKAFWDTGGNMALCDSHSIYEIEFDPKIDDVVKVLNTNKIEGLFFVKRGETKVTVNTIEDWSLCSYNTCKEIVESYGLLLEVFVLRENNYTPIKQMFTLLVKKNIAMAGFIMGMVSVCVAVNVVHISNRYLVFRVNILIHTTVKNIF
jgi:hypothetical protein